MEFVLKSILHAAESGSYLPAVITSLTLPDIAGAVDMPEVGSRQRYVKWIDSWFVPSFPTYVDHDLDGTALYSLRCKLLHEGLSSPSDAPASKTSDAASHKRLVAFNIGGGIVMHLVTSKDNTGDTWTVLNAQQFCAEMVTAARKWMASKTNDDSAQGRINDLVDIRTDVPPISQGVPLICAAIKTSTVRDE